MMSHMGCAGDRISLNAIQEEKESDTNSNNSLRLSRSYERWSPMEEGVTIVWNDLSVYAKTQRKGVLKHTRIINGVSGAVKAGTLVALMGSSGAGKSTLMAALAYRIVGSSVEGDILINGRPVGPYMRLLNGFVHQDDLFVGSLTVAEHMNIMARLKMDRRTTNTERRQKIHQILRDLNMLKCANTKIGSDGDVKILSGGEKKRLAFATELLTDPPLLFCDEPTTGLDSYSAQKIVKIMNTMAARGKTILCTIHQPSSEIFNMFNQVILLADGRIAFIGSTADAIQFFDNLGFACPDSFNPADFLVRTLAVMPGAENASKLSIKRICDQFAVSDYAKEVDVVVQYEFHMGSAGQLKEFELQTKYKQIFLWTQIYWLTYRWFLETLRNPVVQTLRLIQKTAIAVILGLCYANAITPETQMGVQAIQGAIFLFVAENTFNPMYASLAVFPLNTPLFLREYQSGLYSPGVYYLSKIIALIPGLIIDPVIFVVIAYWTAGLRSTAYAFAMTTLITALTLNVSTACGIFFSNAFDSVPTAMAYLVPFDYALMVTSGLFIHLSSLSGVLSWTKYLSWLMYSMESITIIQWEGIQNISCEVSDPGIPCLKRGSDVLDKYSFSEDHLTRDLWSMAFLCIGFHLLAFFCLWWRTKKKRS